MEMVKLRIVGSGVSLNCLKRIHNFPIKIIQFDWEYYELPLFHQFFIFTYFAHGTKLKVTKYFNKGLIGNLSRIVNLKLQ